MTSQLRDRAEAAARDAFDCDHDYDGVCTECVVSAIVSVAEQHADEMVARALKRAAWLAEDHGRVWAEAEQRKEEAGKQEQHAAELQRQIERLEDENSKLLSRLIDKDVISALCFLIDSAGLKVTFDPSRVSQAASGQAQEAKRSGSSAAEPVRETASTQTTAPQPDQVAGSSPAPSNPASAARGEPECGWRMQLGGICALRYGHGGAHSVVAPEAKPPEPEPQPERCNAVSPIDKDHIRSRCRGAAGHIDIGHLSMSGRRWSDLDPGATPHAPALPVDPLVGGMNFVDPAAIRGVPAPAAKTEPKPIYGPSVVEVFTQLKQERDEARQELKAEADRGFAMSAELDRVREDRDSLRAAVVELDKIYLRCAVLDEKLRQRGYGYCDGIMWRREHDDLCRRRLHLLELVGVKDQCTKGEYHGS